MFRKRKLWNFTISHFARGVIVQRHLDSCSVKAEKLRSKRLKLGLL